MEIDASSTFTGSAFTALLSGYRHVMRYTLGIREPKLNACDQASGA